MVKSGHSENVQLKPFLIYFHINFRGTGQNPSPALPIISALEALAT